MNHSMQRWLCCVTSVLVLCGAVAAVQAAEPRRTENVIFVMTDGVRWQEAFGGAESAIASDARYVRKKKLDDVKARFVRPTPEASREALMPFLWNVIAKRGQVYGNRNKHSRAMVTNGLKFSYPGYQETLCGFVDRRIDSNDFGPNPNTTVFEWLHGKPAFQGRVAAFGFWHAFVDIFNRRRCGFCVNAGLDPLTEDIASPKVELLNKLKAESSQVWEGAPTDAMTFHTALEYFKAKRPRAIYISLGETDEWGHGGKYDEYLTAIHRVDAYVKTLWETAQAMPEYRGKTALVLSVDHGRGNGAHWTDHGKNVADAEDIWLAFLGPDTPALGERTDAPTVAQNQIAATLAALLSEDYCAAVPKAGKPIADVLGGQ
jgi:hypothetical protein